MYTRFPVENVLRSSRTKEVFWIRCRLFFKEVIFQNSPTLKKLQKKKTKKKTVKKSTGKFTDFSFILL